MTKIKYIFTLTLLLVIQFAYSSGAVETTPRILHIARMGQPILYKTAHYVSDPSARKVAYCVEDMIATANEHEGCIGLAAPQVHIPLRIIIVAFSNVSGSKYWVSMINPTWHPLYDNCELNWESSLSIPGMTGLVSRYKHISYSYSTLNGERIFAEASDTLARIIQHECDHLDGYLYTDRISNLHKFGYKEEMCKYGASY